MVDFSPSLLPRSDAMRVISTGCSWPGAPTRIWIFSLELMVPLRCAYRSFTVYTVGVLCAVSMSWYRYVLACEAVISAYMLSFARLRWISTMPPRPSTLVSVWLDFQPNLAASNPLRWTQCLDASPLPLRPPLISTSPCAGSTLAKLYFSLILDWLTMFRQSWSKSPFMICFGRLDAA